MYIDFARFLPYLGKTAIMIKIPEGGYEVDRAKTYTKAGPGPFKVGINKATVKTFRAQDGGFKFF